MDIVHVLYASSLEYFLTAFLVTPNALPLYYPCGRASGEFENACKFLWMLKKEVKNQTGANSWRFWDAHFWLKKFTRQSKLLQSAFLSPVFFVLIFGPILAGLVFGPDRLPARLRDQRTVGLYLGMFPDHVSQFLLLIQS